MITFISQILLELVQLNLYDTAVKCFEYKLCDASEFIGVDAQRSSWPAWEIKLLHCPIVKIKLISKKKW